MTRSGRCCTITSPGRRQPPWLATTTRPTTCRAGSPSRGGRGTGCWPRAARVTPPFGHRVSGVGTGWAAWTRRAAGTGWGLAPAGSRHPAGGRHRVGLRAQGPWPGLAQGRGQACERSAVLGKGVAGLVGRPLAADALPGSGEVPARPVDALVVSATGADQQAAICEALEVAAGGLLADLGAFQLGNDRPVGSVAKPETPGGIGHGRDGPLRRACSGGQRGAGVP